MLVNADSNSLALVVFFSKKMLRHPDARSTVAELGCDSAFHPVIGDAERGELVDRDSTLVDRVIFCTGQVSLALRDKRVEEGLKETAIVTIEQLHPFPWIEVKEHVARFSNAKTIVWAQEEPYNGGPWQYMRDRLETVLREECSTSRRQLVYAGRPANAAVATGIAKNHTVEEEKLVKDAFGLDH